MDQREIDEQVRAYYGGVFDEGARLTTRSAQGPLEHRRTQELIAAHIDEGRVLDVGGGTGVHARSLQERGFDVILIDPVPEHVAAAAASGVASQIGDARSLPFPDGSFDAVLMLGPLYHLASATDRVRALNEARRVTRPGGSVFAAALSRYIAFGANVLGRPVRADAAMTALWEQGVPTGNGRFPAGHFHTAEELADEVSDAGLEVLAVHGVEGPGGLALEQIAADRADLMDAALALARATSAEPGIRDFSTHLLAVARVR
ncbi:bifunctional 2-polyprenyl-6-hydroxyphenol methylase/3-demethylubiquinol 3-O-methyltransferase UbiG [Microbacterium sp. CIAB417]|uniref:class I SAM-dependent methyltransferase n=1 Tax=Microbacterium sp. CIAB417 TaxID=2860287 RepID=UPI001FAC02F2|nr:class I SAM-dependent methyltransferase [Microbacterium sp. CIAB417]